MSNTIDLVERMEAAFSNAKPALHGIDTLILDAGTQQRASLDKQAIENYTEAMIDGHSKDFPPLKVVALSGPEKLPDGTELEAGAHILVDGFQRTQAALAAKMAIFQMVVIEGTLQDAVYYSMGANKTNGANLKGKDYRKAIENLYKMSSYWREHGRKQEIAKLLGCSAKTVERATKGIDEQIKKQSFEMFESGATNAEVAAFAVKSEATIKAWRDEWEQSKAGPSDEPEPEKQSSNDNAGTNNPMDLTFAQVLQLKDSALKAQLLKLLMDSVKQDATQAEPEPEPQQDDEPPFEADEPVNDDSPLQGLVDEWSQLDCWGIMGITREQAVGWKNPKTSLKRAYTKQLKRCHPDKFGDNEAAAMLADALSQVKKYIK